MREGPSHGQGTGARNLVKFGCAVREKYQRAYIDVAVYPPKPTGILAGIGKSFNLDPWSWWVWVIIIIFYTPGSIDPRG